MECPGPGPVAMPGFPESIRGWVSLAGDGLGAGREEGGCLQFEVHVEQLFFRFARLFLYGLAVRST